MNILLLGNGAREHCIAESLTKSGRVKLATYAKAKNPGIFGLSEQYQLGSYTDFPAIRDFAKRVKPDFAFLGPDDPIADGVADLLLEAGIHSVAPLKTVARLESSKSFTRDLVQKYGILGNPKFKIFYETAGVKQFLEELGGNFVVKADGLMAGKGVLVSGEHLAGIEDGEQYAKKCIEKFGRVVIEEKLIGQEFSLMSFVDGVHVKDMVPVQDHKRAFVDDKGKNTGGMGSYSASNHLLPFLTQKDLDDAHAITEKVASALFKETGAQFKGIMYGGFMVVRDGVKLIEYNARFGDPEVMNVLPILKTDFVEICEAILYGNLDKIKIEFEAKATVCKYIVPEGYPDKPRAGEKIEITIDPTSYPASAGPRHGGGKLQATSLKMYYASVDQKPDGLYLSSSRAIAFVGIADNLENAEKIAQSACGSVKGPVFYRPDIGTKALIEKRVEMMRKLRG
ncbi:phosphoribosylamine--glycine ligase [Candidatus Peregrinibacteria bacterium]|nr:phosphoribosylamine--glycine ligase [Candidatus Peregrinibacteria bacterium]